MTAAWSHGVYTCAIVCTDERGTFRLFEIASNLDLGFSHDVKQRGTEFEGKPFQAV